jgi:hypothetical protein
MAKALFVIELKRKAVVVGKEARDSPPFALCK